MRWVLIMAGELRALATPGQFGGFGKRECRSAACSCPAGVIFRVTLVRAFRASDSAGVILTTGRVIARLAAGPQRWFGGRVIKAASCWPQRATGTTPFLTSRLAGTVCQPGPTLAYLDGGPTITIRIGHVTDHSLTHYGFAAGGSGMMLTLSPSVKFTGGFSMTSSPALMPSLTSTSSP